MKIYIIKSLLFVAGVLIFCGCNFSKNSSGGTAEYAEGFRIIEKKAGSTVLSDAMGRKLTVLHGNTAGSGSEGNMTFRSPAEKVICSTSSVVSLLRPLDEVKSVQGVTLDKDKWYISEMRQAFDRKQITMIGNGMSDINYELIAALRPDVVFTNSDHYRNRSAILDRSGIKSVIVHEYQESSLLGQFEWIKPVAEFYGKGKEAEEIFRKRADNYRRIREKARSAKGKPGVLWGVIFQGRAFAPGGESYVSGAISDGGGEYLLKKESKTGSVPCSRELFYEKGVNADIFIFSSAGNYGISTIKELVASDELYGSFKSVKEGKVWCFKPWYWQSIDKPDEILEDIAAIIHPEAFPGHSLRHFEKMPAE